MKARKGRGLSKNHRRAREGRNPPELSTAPDSACGGGTIFRGGKSRFPEQRTFSCSFCVRKSERILAKTGRSDSGGGLLSRPSACHKLFSTSPRGHGVAVSDRAKKEQSCLTAQFLLPCRSRLSAAHCFPPSFFREAPKKSPSVRPRDAAFSQRGLSYSSICGPWQPKRSYISRSAS